jgi:hypothetical protein
VDIVGNLDIIEGRRTIILLYFSEKHAMLEGASIFNNLSLSQMNYIGEAGKS